MCGIAGFIDDAERSERTLTARAATMADSIRHRGPDDGGVWTDADAGLALAQRRLSIIDLSPAGHQPMVSQDGRLVIVFNGEIYNYRALRTALEARGSRFPGNSDTEVLLESCAVRGIAATVQDLIGMFAFVVWDRRERTLTLVRDRLGIKPMYWGRFGGLFLFGSELKALRAHPGWTPELDRRAAASFMRHGHVPAPFSIYRGVHKLPPGAMLTLPADGAPRIESYWDLRAVARANQAGRAPLDDRTAVEQLDSLLRDAVRLRMIADVPLGAFLSGGVDSSTVTALMQAQSSRPVNTFSIGFREAGYDEAAHARAVAAHLGTDHSELYVAPEDALAVVPSLPEMFDEPFADSSQIPTFLLSRMTRRRVTVALSGDGGDELFGGYNRHLWGAAVERRFGRLPSGLRRALGSALIAVPPTTWDAAFRAVPDRLRPPQAGDKLHKLGAALGQDGDALYRRLVSQWPDPDALVVDGAEERGLLWDAALRSDFPDPVERMQFLDAATYLPDDVLTKVDRASMAVGLEARVPMLDHRVVEFAWHLPIAMKIRDGQGKWLLRRVLDRHVPRPLIERPKAGFAIPIDSWLRGPLRDWAEDLLDERRLRDGGLLHPEPIRQAWQQHLSGRRNLQHPLWTVLMFQAWCARWGGPADALPETRPTGSAVSLG